MTFQHNQLKFVSVNGNPCSTVFCLLGLNFINKRMVKIFSINKNLTSQVQVCKKDWDKRVEL